jgi:hypothetical protein
MEMTFSFDIETGEASFIHSDEAMILAKDALGDPDMKIRRASDVEPTEDARWTADMARVDGPVLGPFITRTEALAREVEWLLAHKL